MESIKNIIFDFGGILVDLNKQAAIDAFKTLGFSAEHCISDYVQAGVFTALETGRMNEEDFFAFISQETGKDIASDDIRNAWNQMLVRIPLHRLQAVKALRDRFCICMLSNTNSIHWDFACRTLFPQQEWRPEDCFDRIFLSHEIHLAKPDPTAFLHVLKEADLLPEETLFIDDSAANCASAQSVGMQVFHSCRPDDWLEIIPQITKK